MKLGLYIYGSKRKGSGQAP